MRHRKNRRIRFSPHVIYFKPCGIPLKTLAEVELRRDEMEAVRLKYHKNLEQKDCALKMDISQSTFHRILSSANRKIAEALTEGKALKIEENSL
ncbi:DUF134 domain-containing protein [Candidatus Peregrinibacteria bacterium]|nr:DUF134 domain-containing protein [Candidatus Peregrinibacteria bacterium]